MNENEDYLESLLKAAANNDNPDSAISRVREISKNAAAKEEPEVVDINSGVSDEIVDNSDLADLLSSNENDDSYGSITESKEQAEALLYESELDAVLGDISQNTDIQNDDNNISSEDISALLDSEEQNDSIEPMEGSTDNLVEVEEVDIDSLLSDDPGIVSDFPSDEELDAVSGESVTVDSSEELQSENVDIDSLLSSDFSGEIELPADDSLTLENESDNASMDSPVDNSALLDEGSNEDFNMSDIESLLNEENSLESLNESSDSVSDMSEEDISKMLDAASSVDVSNSDGEVAIDLDDMASLENEFGIFEKNDMTQGDADESGELQEISSLLDSIDSNEVNADSDDEMLNLLNEAVAKSVEEDELEEALKNEKKEEATEAEGKESGKKKGKKKKNKKDKGGAVDQELKEKSKFAKFFEYITASDEDEEESLINAVDADAEGNENVPDGENKEILNEIDSEEEGKGKKGKKKKDKKGKKGKKGKGEAEGDSEESEDGDSEEGDGKKGKKPKKEKKPRKPLELDIDTGKPLNKKNVILIFVLSLSVMACIIVFVKLVPPMMSKKEARDAFFRGEYETTYTTFFGEKKLKDADQVLFDRSTIILKIRHKYEAFEAYRKIGMEVEALDQLLQGIEDHDEWLQFAITCGAEAQFEEEYAMVLDALMRYYDLSEASARKIIALPTNLEYSLMVESIVKKTPYIDPNEPLPGEYVPSEEESAAPAMQDVLREEGM